MNRAIAAQTRSGQDMITPLPSIPALQAVTAGEQDMARALSKAQQELLADLAGGVEIGDALGVTRAVVSMWQGRYDDFPQPVLQLSAGRFYRLSEVLEWHARRFSS